MKVVIVHPERRTTDSIVITGKGVSVTLAPATEVAIELFESETDLKFTVVTDNENVTLADPDATETTPNS